MFFHSEKKIINHALKSHERNFGISKIHENCSHSINTEFFAYIPKNSHDCVCVTCECGKNYLNSADRDKFLHSLYVKYENIWQLFILWCKLNLKSAWSEYLGSSGVKPMKMIWLTWYDRFADVTQFNETILWDEIKWCNPGFIWCLLEHKTLSQLIQLNV